MRRRIVRATVLVALLAVGALGVPLLIMTQLEINTTAKDQNWAAEDLLTFQVESIGIEIALALVAVGVAVVLADRVSRRLSTPLYKLAEDASRLADGDLRPSGNRYGVAELDEVARALDTAALRLSDLVQRERDFAGNVSHQLRSRLTALSMRLEEIGASCDGTAQKEAEAALDQVDRMVEVIEDLLEQARAERAGSASKIDMGDQLKQVDGEWTPVLAAEGRELRVTYDRDLVAKATPGHVQQAIGVLVENAMVHGGGTVEVSAFRRGEHIVIEVTDGGAGLPVGLDGSVFARGVSGRGGTGLGLPLARTLVEADSGRLELVRSVPATFAIYLPGLPAS
jgi:signal transduction histidine kinase